MQAVTILGHRGSVSQDAGTTAARSGLSGWCATFGRGSHSDPDEEGEAGGCGCDPSPSGGIVLGGKELAQVLLDGGGV